MNYDPVARIKRKLTDRMLQAGDMAAQELRAVVGVQAPLVPGSEPPRAATPATPGSPPRRVSGQGQGNVYFLFHLDDDEAKLSFGDARWYMIYHEMHDHPWIAKTIRRLVPDMVRILKKP